MHPADCGRRDRAHVDDQAPARRRGQQTAFAVDHILDLRRVRQHRDREIGVRDGLGEARRRDRPLCRQRRDRLLDDVEDGDRMPGFEEVADHLAAHRAEPDEADATCSVFCHLPLSRHRVW